MQQYVGDQPVTFKGPAVRVDVTAAGASTVGVLRAKEKEGAAAIPGVVAREQGKGRVVYLPAGFDAAYYLYSYPYQRLILRHAIDWAAAAPPPVRIEAPMCVHATVMRQAATTGERLIVHLFNDLNTTAQHGLPIDDVPLREETIPIRDICVTFAPGYRLRGIRQEPEGRDLAATTDASGTSVSVPQLEVHSMVVGELAPAAGQ
jgi:hypothetical protein